MNRDWIKDRNGKVLGYIDTDSNGNKVAKTRDGKVVGYYKEKFGTTTDASGKVISRSDTVVSLIFSQM